MELNVYGGTARDHATSLCASCKHAHNREYQTGTTFTYCGHVGQRVPAPVLRCNEYMHKNQQYLGEYKEIAWVISPGREHLGFRPVSKLSDEEKDELRKL